MNNTQETPVTHEKIERRGFANNATEKIHALSDGKTLSSSEFEKSFIQNRKAGAIEKIHQFPCYAETYCCFLQEKHLIFMGQECILYMGPREKILNEMHADIRSGIAQLYDGYKEEA